MLFALYIQSTINNENPCTVPYTQQAGVSMTSHSSMGSPAFSGFNESPSEEETKGVRCIQADIMLLVCTHFCSFSLEKGVGPEQIMHAINHWLNQESCTAHG